MIPWDDADDAEFERTDSPIRFMRKKHGGNAATLRNYWTKTPEGLAKWADSRKPWTTLVSHLKKYVKDPEGLAAEYYHDVFGRWPGKPRKGKKGKRK